MCFVHFAKKIFFILSIIDIAPIRYRMLELWHLNIKIVREKEHMSAIQLVRSSIQESRRKTLLIILSYYPATIKAMIPEK